MSRPPRARRPRVRFRSDRGATAVEFALLVPFVLALLTGLVFLGFRSVYAALAQEAAKEAVRTAVLPPLDASVTSEQEVCEAAVAAVPAVFGPGEPSCNGTQPGPTPAPTTTPAPRAAVAVRVCPPDCAGFQHAVQCVALPARLAAQGDRAPRQVALSPFFTRAPEPPPAPSPTVSPPSTVGATLSPTPVQLPDPPAVTPRASATAGGEVRLPSATASAGAGLDASASASPAVPPLPTPQPTPRGACTDDRQGRLVAVEVTWEVGVLGALAGLTGGVLSDDLATVTGTATGRRE